MTRLVPRPDWTPVEFVLAVRAAVWEQGVTPETAANRPTVLALFRPAEEPEPVSSSNLPMQPIEIAKDGMTRFRPNRVVAWAVDSGRINLSDVSGMDFPAEDRMQFAQLIGYSIGGYGELSYVSDASYQQAAAVADEIELNATMDATAPVAPLPAEERKEWPPKRPKPVALIPTPTCSEERDPWGNAESRVRTLAHEANNEAGADVAIHLFRAAHDAALAALRSELSASQREVERLRQQLDPPTQSGSFGATTAKVAGKCIQCNGDIYHDPHHIGEYLHVCVPSGENRSEDAGPPPAGGTK